MLRAIKPERKCAPKRSENDAYRTRQEGRLTSRNLMIGFGGPHARSGSELCASPNIPSRAARPPSAQLTRWVRSYIV